MAIPNTLLTAAFGHDGPAVVGMPAADFVLFWDKDVRLARALEACGFCVFNRADAIALCDDKAATHLMLAREGIPMPDTMVAPMTYLKMDEPGKAFLTRAEKRFGFPMVVKECYGSLGGQVYLARNMEELYALMDQMAARPFIIQEFVSGQRWPGYPFVYGGRKADRRHAADIHIRFSRQYRQRRQGRGIRPLQ